MIDLHYKLLTFWPKTLIYA